MRTKLAIALLSIAALAACATTDPNTISYRDAQRMSTVQDATVLSVRPVKVDGSQSGGGAAAGGVVGAVAGSSIGGRRDNLAFGVLGAVAGAVAGNAIERSATSENAVEILVQLPNGERRAVVQGATGETLQPGDAVILVTSGGKTRVSRAPYAPRP
jgi:outer membrane lipoprotein SlyB